MKNVRIIPVIPKENKKLRVAAYCRVSTSRPEQLRSLEIQIKAYTKIIKSHPNWLYAGVFYDIESGRRSGRSGLDKMLGNVAKGKIDYIITKSISRVSRDTLEVLKIIRFLRERGINMHFENEKLDSIEAEKEFEITLRAMLHRTKAGIPAKIFSGVFSASSKKAISLRSIRILWDTLAMTVRLSLCQNRQK